ELAIEAARLNARAHYQKFVLAKRVQGAGQLSKEEVAMLDESQKALDTLVKLEQAKLREIKDVSFADDIARARQDVEAKKAQGRQADLGVVECDVYAPRDGSILKLQLNVGEVLSKDPKLPILQLCPDEPRIIRAEVLQEWAHLIKPQSVAFIEDDAGRNGKTWTGRVLSVSDWFTGRRHRLLEPFQYNDVRTLECLIAVINDDATQPLRIHQRMRVKIYY